MSPFQKPKKKKKQTLNPTEISSFCQLQKEFFCLANAPNSLLLDRPLKNSVKMRNLLMKATALLM